MRSRLRPLPGRRRAWGFALAIAVAAAAPVFAEILVNPEGWRFPNVVTAAKEAIKVSERTPLIPGKETLLKGYRKADGTHFMTYEIEGRVFGVEVDTDGKPPFEYSLLDTDGDTKFESKIVHAKDNKDRAYVPQWVIDHYYSVHPELKSGGGDVKIPAPTLKPSVPIGPAAAATPPPRSEPPSKEVRAQPNP